MKITGPLTITATKYELRALCAFASRDQFRTHLSGLGIDGPANRIAASDGHRLLCWTGTEEKLGTSLRGVVSATVIGRLLGALPKVVTIKIDEERKGVHLGALAFIPFTDREPPPYDMVIPKQSDQKPSFPVAIDPQYLGALRLCRKFSEHVQVYSSGEIDPVLFTMQNGWLAVIMPRRVTGGPYAPPVAPASPPVSNLAKWAAESLERTQVVRRWAPHAAVAWSSGTEVATKSTHDVLC